MSRKSMLTKWEWETLVASWRYYQHGHTITSASFPVDLVCRYWGKFSKATDADRRLIASQFVNIDHRHGPDDKIDGWPLDGVAFGGMDARPWRRLWFFLDAVANGRGVRVHAVGNGADSWLDCFKADDGYVPIDAYVASPDQIGCIKDEFVKEVK